VVDVDHDVLIAIAKMPDDEHRKRGREDFIMACLL
jgi:hypothetical protein